MPKEVPNKRYTGELKQKIIETMKNEKLSYIETAERFELRHKRVQDWEQIYLNLWRGVNLPRTPWMRR